MVISNNYRLNIVDLINNIEANSILWEKDIVDEFVNFVNNDPNIIMMVKGLLINRLKYSTGRLYNSIFLQATPGRAGGTTRATAYHNVNIRLVIDSDDESLVNALLGEKELMSRPQAKPPTILELTRWVRGKRRFFDKPIQAIKDRQKDVVRALLQRQRRILMSGEEMEEGTAGKLNLPSKEETRDPIYELAKIIKGRMLRRIEKGLPLTKGSEYVFLGNYPAYEGSVGASSFAPRYRVMNTPLLTIKKRKSLVGDINVLIGKMIDNYYQDLIKKYIKKGLAGELAQPVTGKPSTTQVAGVTVSGQLRSLSRNVTGSIVQKTMSLINKASEIVEESPGSNRTKAKAAWLKEGRAMIMSTVDDLFAAMDKEANKENAEVFRALKQAREQLLTIKAFVPPPVKRRARRFKRR